MAKSKIMVKNPKSNRDLALTQKAAYNSSVKALTPKEDVDSRAANLQRELKELNKLVTIQEQLVQTLLQSGASLSTVQSAQANLELYKSRQPELGGEMLFAANRSGVTASNLKGIANAATLASTAIAEASSTVVTNKKSNLYGSLDYNASAVKEAYFSQKSSFLDHIQSPNNQPRAITQAVQLFTSISGAGSKGMIVTSEQVLKAWNSGGNKAATSDYYDHHNYGFQFQYNPGTVNMSYYTSPNVDVTMMTSGQEMFNLAGVSSSQGSVSFQIVINRIFDMQYYKSTGELKTGFTAGGIYPVAPKQEDLVNIYKKGTMCDVEYLLRVLMGTTMNSYLRGEKTADMGWLPAIPVELHLGKSLKYLGTVNNVSLNHIIFDARMVPLFTTMDIGFARLPDYPATESVIPSTPGIPRPV
jgi:hypothetical protein